MGSLIEHALTGGLDFIQQIGHLPAGLDLELLPEPDLRRGGAGLVLLQERRHRLEPPGQRRQAILQGCEVAGEDREESIPDRVHGRGAALPDAVDLHVEELATNVVQGQLALEADAVRQRLRVDRLEFPLDAMHVRDLLHGRIAGGIVKAVISIVQADVRAEDRVPLQHTPEFGFDDAPEALVGRAGGWLGSGPRENELCHGVLLRCWA